MTELKEDNLSGEIMKNDKVIVQYSASWCGACRIAKPKFEKMSTKNEDVKFLYVDIESSPESRRLANVSSIPTFAGFLNGELVKQVSGANDKKIQEVLNELNN